MHAFAVALANLAELDRPIETIKVVPEKGGISATTAYNMNDSH
jgi:hypothetical protein